MNIVKKSLFSLYCLSLVIGPLYAASPLDLELIEAVKNRDAKAVACQLQQGADVNAKIEDHTPLMIAINQLVQAAHKKSFTSNGFIEKTGAFLLMLGEGLIIRGPMMSLMADMQKIRTLEENRDNGNSDRAFDRDDAVLFGQNSFKNIPKNKRRIPKRRRRQTALREVTFDSSQKHSHKKEVSSSQLPTPEEEQAQRNILKKAALAFLGFYAFMSVKEFLSNHREQTLLAGIMVIQELMKDPNIDLTLTNDKNQTALDIIHGQVCANIDNQRVRTALMNAEQLLIATQTKHRFEKLNAA
jgi:hypothetical protein